MELALGLIFGLVAGFSIGLILSAFVGYFVIKKRIAMMATTAADAATGYIKDKAYVAAVEGAKQLKQRWYNRPKADAPERSRVGPWPPSGDQS